MQKVAIVHDWFTTFAGSEKVVAQILQVFPRADLFSLIDYLPADDRVPLGQRVIHTSFLQNAPFVAKYYRYYLPLMPLAIERLNLAGYDLIISSCHAVAKGVITGPEQLHISYIHTPMRYAWDMQEDYLNSGGLKDAAARIVFRFVRGWDVRAAQRPDRMIANSQFVAERIRRIYGRPAGVIYPPVDTDYFIPAGAKEDFYLTVSRLAPYKRVDLIARAFQAMPDKKLVIIGDGEQAPMIRELRGPNITWLGGRPDDVLRHHMQRCRAFVFAAKDDFGITPLEAQACGVPVIAYGEGGVKETIQGLEGSNPTGILYPAQTVAAIQAAVFEFERNRNRFSIEACRENAERFSPERFRTEFQNFVRAAWQEFHPEYSGQAGDA